MCVCVRTRVCVRMCEYLTRRGACLTSEPGIYTAPRWRLQFILNERIINSVDRMMYLKHLPVTAQSLPAVRMSGMAGTVLSSV